jgi:MFS family permease
MKNPSSLRKSLELVKEKEFSFFILTRFLVIFSLFMQTTVLSYKLYTITGDPLSLGLIGLAEVIPAFTLALFAGWFVDKKEKRTMYLLCIVFYIFNALLLAYLTSNLFTQSHSVKFIAWSIYAAMFLNGCIRAFLAPASFSLLPLLISRDKMPQAITWSSTSWMLGSVLGPLCGGLLLAAIGITNTFVFAIGCLGISVLCIQKINKKPIHLSAKQGIVSGLAEGFKFVFSSQIILAVLCLDLFAVLFGGAEALLPIYAKEILQVGEVGYGWLRSAHGIGAIFLLLILAYIPLKKQIGIKLLFCVAAFGAMILLFGISTNVYLSFACLFLAGLFDGVSVVIRHSILQLKTPEAIKGRVSSINMMFISSSNELGAFESGLTARWFGTVPAVVIGGAMTILVVLSTSIFAPRLKKLDNLDADFNPQEDV